MFTFDEATLMGGTRKDIDKAVDMNGDYSQSGSRVSSTDNLFGITSRPPGRRSV